MPQTLHFSAPYQITIDGFSEARAYWRFEDMQEAAAQLEREGYRFIRYDRADDGCVRPLPQDVRDDRVETRYQRVAREQAERQRDRRLRQEAERHHQTQRELRQSSADRRAADRIDGYDRDDLGLSPDF